ncbi:CRISPR-associated protein Cas2 [Methyloligella sp. 2.7D]|uniref:CRISPR-associated protein Cas2 n=1 Tax=unclassified Methyloligella TaxID=2625955 RepID=UPI00157C20E4|nr:CRISPR-associated protein Cas2 [Methyloligella sp. GL2]QKP76580.1 CRISPR-associated protein Cas2 [Methyloligella sp. GL2]
MTSYLLSYDLMNETGSADYEPLFEELKRWDAQRTQYSVWLLADNSTAKEVHDHFKRHLDSDDRLWVTEIVKNKYYSNAISGTNAWLAENPPTR